MIISVNELITEVVEVLLSYGYNILVAILKIKIDKNSLGYIHQLYAYTSKTIESKASFSSFALYMSKNGATPGEHRKSFKLG